MNILQIKDLFKSYDKNYILDNINLTILTGSIYYIIGENGSGKTTLLKIISGLLYYDKGEVFIDGVPVSKSKIIKNLIGYLSQSKGLPRDLTVKEYLTFQANTRRCDKQYAFELLEHAQLNLSSDKMIYKLSEGNQRKLAVITTLLHKPRLLIMDEPTVGLDPLVRDELCTYISSLKKFGLTAIIASHYLEEAEKFGDKILLLSNGKLLYEGTQSEFYTKYKFETGLELELINKEENSECIEFMEKNNIPFAKSFDERYDKIRIIAYEYSNEHLPFVVDLLKHNFNIKKIAYIGYSLNDLVKNAIRYN